LRWRGRLAFVGAGACACLVGQAIGLGLLEWPPGGLPGFPWWEPPAAYADPASGPGLLGPWAVGELPPGEAAWLASGLIPVEHQGLLGAGSMSAVPAAFVGPVSAAAGPLPAGPRPAPNFSPAFVPEPGAPLSPTSPAAGSSVPAGPDSPTPPAQGGEVVGAVGGDVAGTAAGAVGGVERVSGDVVGAAGDLAGTTTGVVGGVVRVPGYVVGTASDVVGTATGAVSDVARVPGDVVTTAGDAVGTAAVAVGGVVRVPRYVAAAAGDVAGTTAGNVVATTTRTVPDAVADTAGAATTTIRAVGETVTATKPKPSVSVSPRQVVDTVEHTVHATTGHTDTTGDGSASKETPPSSKSDDTDSPSNDHSSGAVEQKVVDVVTPSVHAHK
jgi:hypothetical protein